MQVTIHVSPEFEVCLILPPSSQRNGIRKLLIKVTGTQIQVTWIQEPALDIQTQLSVIARCSASFFSSTRRWHMIYTATLWQMKP